MGYSVKDFSKIFNRNSGRLGKAKKSHDFGYTILSRSQGNKFYTVFPVGQLEYFIRSFLTMDYVVLLMPGPATRSGQMVGPLSCRLFWIVNRLLVELPLSQPVHCQPPGYLTTPEPPARR